MVHNLDNVFVKIRIQGTNGAKFVILPVVLIELEVVKLNHSKIVKRSSLDCSKKDRVRVSEVDVVLEPITVSLVFLHVQGSGLLGFLEIAED